GIDPSPLAASVGTVTENADGTVSWSFATSNGPSQSQTVTITATDSDGASSTATFNLVVNNAAPLVIRAAASSVTVIEGQTASMSGTWSDPGASSLTLSASVGTVTKNADGPGRWCWATSDGPSDSQTVTITGTDSNGGRASASFALVVTNAAPVFTRLVSSNSTFADPSAFGMVSIEGAFTDPGIR